MLGLQLMRQKMKPHCRRRNRSSSPVGSDVRQNQRSRWTEAWGTPQASVKGSNGHLHIFPRFFFFITRRLHKVKVPVSLNICGSIGSMLQVKLNVSEGRMPSALYQRFLPWRGEGGVSVTIGTERTSSLLSPAVRSFKVKVVQLLLKS